ncbi:CD1247 N-terminal domain-containing protein [Caproiciproducens sp.]|uniref:CD1247 N-terminal domain-containing protein n=1 Tax=Caproiciproducens sp. TaxID=1954376 RepID=UPI00289C23FA|nr:CD1247 N-terminal domain-containing protein [Caproiciproducens sp.]
MTNKEKVAYIRGLAEGLELDENKKEVKVINAIIDLLDDMAASVSDMQDSFDDMADQLDAVDEDLGSLEEDFYEDEDDGDEDGDDDEGDCYYEVTCPNCHETICLSEDIIEDGQMDCPNCGETLEFDIDEDDDGCGCDDCDHQ